MILNERPPSYVQDLQTALEALVASRPMPAKPAGDAWRTGAMFILRADLISAEVRDLLQTAARAVLAGTRQPRRAGQTGAGTAAPGARAGEAPRRREPADRTPPRRGRRLEFFNGLGGFADDGPRICDHVSTTGNRRPRPGSM